MSIITFSFKKRPVCLSYLFAIVLALLISSYLFTFSFLQGQGAFFESGDASQHISGWLFYVHDHWRFPLGYTQNLNYPEGANIALTDSIPLAAVFFKLLRPWLPVEFHYFGWWHLFAYLLQAVAATFLVRSLGYSSFLATLAAVIFALLMPALTMRYGHTSLTTHGLILFALGAYALGIKRQWSLCYATCIFILISMLALLIHPYLFGMVYLIFLAFLIDFAFKNHAMGACIKFFMLSVLVVLLMFFLFGYFGMGGDGGYGFYSMNLLSPFCGGQYSISCANVLGQYEGFNYLGLGLIIVLIFTVITQRPWLRQLPGRFPALTTLMVLFWLFSLSNVIYFGHYELIKVKLPHRIAELAAVYRASGRMFWPVGYALMFVGIIGALRFPKKGVLLLGLFVVALVLQWFDTEKLMSTQRLALRQPGLNNDQKWDALADSVVAIDIFPVFLQYLGNNERYHFFQLLAARKKLAFNTALLTHYTQNPVEKQHFFDQPLASNHLYIVLPEVPFASIPRNIQALLRAGQCRQFTLSDHSVAMACIPGRFSTWWQERAPWMEAINKPSYDK